jgi:hypothetical protein
MVGTMFPSSGEIGGSIIDGVKRNHSGGCIFTPRIFGG